MKTDQRIYTLKRGTSEWDRAWAGCCPDGKFDEGEGWQYMGTVQLESGAYAHQFRNRCINGQREYRNVSAVQFPTICEEVYEPVIVYTAVCTLSGGQVDCILYAHRKGSDWRDGDRCEAATMATEEAAVSNVARRYGIDAKTVTIVRQGYEPGDIDATCKQCERTIAKTELVHNLCMSCRQQNEYDKRRHFREEEIGGAVDAAGNVSSDADSGL